MPSPADVVADDGSRKVDGEVANFGHGGGHGYWAAGSAAAGVALGPEGVWCRPSAAAGVAGGLVQGIEVSEEEDRHRPIGVGGGPFDFPLSCLPRIGLPPMSSSRHRSAWSAGAASPADCPRGPRC
jgi:hypothetical protein